MPDDGGDTGDPVRRLGHRPVGVEAEERAEVECLFRLELFKDAGEVRGEVDGGAVDARRRLDGADGAGRAVEEFGVFGALSERLVPNLPFDNYVAVALHDGGAVAQPGREGVGIVRDLSHAHAEREVAAPDGIAVGEADPGLHAGRGAFADNRVEPFEVVAPLFALGLGPTRKDAGVLDAEQRKKRLVGMPVRVVAVEAFATHGPVGIGYLQGRASGEASDFGQPQFKPVEEFADKCAFFARQDGRRVKRRNGTIHGRLSGKSAPWRV